VIAAARPSIELEVEGDSEPLSDRAIAMLARLLVDAAERELNEPEVTP